MHIKHTGRFMLAALLAAGFLSQPAMADKATWFGDNQANGAWLVGVKTGNMVHEATGYENTTSNGLMLGYMFNRPVMGNGTASVEFEATSSDDGRFDATSALGQTGKWNVKTKSLYFAYRSAGTVYFKGKVGGVVADIENVRDSGATDNDTVEESQISLGAGVGIRVTDNANLEVEWASSQGINDINYVSLGASLKF